MAVTDTLQPPPNQPPTSQGRVPLPPIIPPYAQRPTYQTSTTVSHPSVLPPFLAQWSSAVGLSLGSGLILLGLLIGIVWVSRRE